MDCIGRDITRRLCLLNPHCFDPCLEGEGILLIDQIDHQLDQNMSAEIFRAFVSSISKTTNHCFGNRDELLEHALEYQCLQLSDKEIYEMNIEKSQQQLSQLYNELSRADDASFRKIKTYSNQTLLAVK